MSNFDITWIHGSEDCSTSTDPPIQLHNLDSDTVILRQSKCSDVGTMGVPGPSSEAPFMYLLFGDDRAFLLDTGATRSASKFPLAATIRSEVDRWCTQNGRGPLPLLIGHSHSHRDHAAGDSQFEGDPDVEIVDLGIDPVSRAFGINEWPNDIGILDLGSRILDVIPIPGHEKTHVAFYDRRTTLLFTGDSVYPGLLVVNDWTAYRNSIARLVDFAESNAISFVLGAHIEMTADPGRWFGLGTFFQPNEHSLQLARSHIYELHNSLKVMGDTPRVDRHADFIVYPAGSPLPPLDP